MKSYLLKLINAKVSLPSFAWVLSSLILAIYIAYHFDVLGVTPFAQNLHIGLKEWTFALITGDSFCLIGMLWRPPHIPIVRIGAFISFMCWLFGNLALLQTHGWQVVIWVTGWYVLMYAYLYLAGSLGVFKRHAP